MKINVERENWTRHNPDLVVLVGDPYANFIGPTPEPVEERLKAFAEGFARGELRKEISFSAPWSDSAPSDCIYFHSSTQKGFTATENLKTFLSKALHLACDTGRKKVAMILKGPDGEGITEQMVEGALVGTFSFREYKKDNQDRFSDLELILCLPDPPTSTPDSPTEEQKVSAQAQTIAFAVESEESKEEVTEEAAEPEETGDATPEDSSSQESEEAPESESVEQSEAAAAPEASPTEVETATEPEPEAEPEPEPEPAPTSPPTPVVDEEAFSVLRKGDETAVLVGRAFADGVNLARELVSRPACDCTPDFLAKTCKKLAATHRFSYQSFAAKQLESHGYAGLIAVGKGADNGPKMVEMTYTPEQESEVHLVLLGKGVTFDSGGISIKGADKMHMMIGDMAGAAAVIGAMETLGRLRPSIKVTGLIVSAENKPSSKSFRPGDIIRYKNGLSVHVENTDAEGRLILADGLIRAGELGATHIVDLATLTGACARALGPSFTGVMGANRKLVNAITRAGGNHGESYWRLPMPVEYQDMLKTIHADLNNTGGPYAGATTAALFLKEFVPAGTPWVHLDIAGTFWKEKPWKYYSEGPSGTGVKTIADLALRWREHLS